MKKIGVKTWLVLILAGVALGAYSAFASSLIAYYYPTGATGTQSLSGTNYVGQKFHVGGSTQISGFTFRAAFGTTNVARSWTLGLFDSTGTSLASRSISNSLVGAHSSDTNITLSFSSPVSVTSGDYFIGILYVSGEGVTMREETTSAYSFGCRIANYSGTGALPSCSSADLYFDVQGNLGSVSISFPSDAVSLKGDFNAWLLNYSIPAGDTTFTVSYGTSPTSLTSTSSVGKSVADSLIGSYILVPKNDALTVGGTYWARANIVQSSVNIATSSVINFQVAGTSAIDSFTQFTPTSAPTATSTALTITCDPADGLFANSFCKLFTYLFIPDPSVWDQFRSLQTDVEHKPPFGYWTVYKNAFSSSTLAVGTSTISLPAIQTLTVFSDLRTGIQWVLYFVLGVFIIKRFSKIEL